MSFLDPRPAIILTGADADRLSALAETARSRQPDVADMLEAEVARAAIVAPADLPPDTVTMGSHVTFGYDHARRSHWLTLVYPAEADLDKAKISVATPVGAALIGLREGQSIAWTTASGAVRRITLHKVAYQPERAGRCDP
ncbi:nucleoside diphosphate kinase regulator [Ferrovibrio sp.]|uniref:nucleoside diphosphate kinase regulator n=1 Tax=Ferrovibrio sp. TaxID=1917215 RepID=UPI000CC13634|nr:nucleoside diphosphate kinase regulator [Ferrovibrio sp.]PJI39625.1 MAG: nucleoside diphosphate kinase regulator [Ferrovibrio sp.]